MHFSSLLAAASASLLLTTVVASPAAAPLASAKLARRSQLLPREDDVGEVSLHDDDEHHVYAEMEHVFGVIESIPDEVLEKGDDATHAWVAENDKQNDKELKDVSERDLEDRGVWDVTKCAAAITAFVGSNVVGWTKLLRIKKYIKALGGGREAAELLLKASTWAERRRIGGSALVALAGEILGVDIIANNCT